MSRVMTFSRHYPGYHPRAGEETFFVEQIYNSIGLKLGITYESGDLPKEMHGLVNDFFLLDGRMKKHHTIRAGNRWKVGDWFSPRVWGNDVNPTSGRSGPYQSKQIIIAPDIQVKKTWDFVITVADDVTGVFIDGWPFYEEYLKAEVGPIELAELAKNDGLTVPDFKAWFKWPKPFSGQIICWNENIEY